MTIGKKIFDPKQQISYDSAIQLTKLKILSSEKEELKYFETVLFYLLNYKNDTKPKPKQDGQQSKKQ